MKKLKFWIKKNFGVLTKQECLDLGLEFGFNIYGDGINKLNCRSIWLDYWGKTFRCSELGERERAIPKVEESQQKPPETIVNQHIPYEQALQLKELLDFNEPCFGIFITKEFRYANTPIKGYDVANGVEVLAPTFSQVFRWFREKYDCSHNITKTIGGEYIPYVNGYELDIDDNCEEVVGFKWIYKTYEEAELACLKKLIEIAKTKTK